MDFDFASFILGAGLMTASHVLGIVRGRKKKGYQDPKPICSSCSHGIGYHRDRKECHHSGWDRCKCKQYTGPEPLPEFI